MGPLRNTMPYVDYGLQILGGPNLYKKNFP